MTSKIASYAMVGPATLAHTLRMPRKARAHPKPTRQRIHLREWRKHREMSLEKLSERLLVEEEIEISPGQLSRIERGKQPYAQDLMEAVGRVLRCDVVDIIMRDPTQPNSIWSIWDSLSQPAQAQAVELLRVLQKTGTHN